MKVEFKATDNSPEKEASYHIVMDGPFSEAVIQSDATCDDRRCSIRGSHTFPFTGSFTVRLIRTVSHTASEDPFIDENLRFPKIDVLGAVTVVVSGGPAQASLHISPTKGENKLESKITVTGYGGPFVVDFGNGQYSMSQSFYLLNKDDSWSVTESYSRTGFATNDIQVFQVKLFSQDRLIDEGRISVLPPVNSPHHNCQVAAFKLLKGEISKEEKVKACKDVDSSLLSILDLD